MDPVKAFLHAAAAVLLSFVLHIMAAEFSWRNLGWDGLSSLGFTLAVDLLGPVGSVFQLLLLLWRLVA